MDYKNAGVDIEAGYESVKLMKKFVQKTMRPEVLTDIAKRKHPERDYSSLSQIFERNGEVK